MVPDGGVHHCGSDHGQASFNHRFTTARSRVRRQHGHRRHPGALIGKNETVALQNHRMSVRDVPGGDRHGKCLDLDPGEQQTSGIPLLHRALKHAQTTLVSGTGAHA